MILIAGISLIAALVAALVMAEVKQSRRGRFIFKPLASVGFLALALALGALDSGFTYGHLVFAGLVLSFFGDVFLMPDGKPAFFLAGLGSFLLGHVAYAAAFVSHGVDTHTVLVSLALMVPAAWLVWRWLAPHIPKDMVFAVIAYIAVICTMEAFSAGATAVGREAGHAGSWLMLVGATMFWVSDLAVARRQFIDPSPSSAVWGLPLYYGAQVVLALSLLVGRTAL